MRDVPIAQSACLKWPRRTPGPLSLQGLQGQRQIIRRLGQGNGLQRGLVVCRQLEAIARQKVVQTQLGLHQRKMHSDALVWTDAKPDEGERVPLLLTGGL